MKTQNTDIDFDDFDAPSPPPKEVLGTGTNPPARPLTDVERAELNRKNGEYAKRRTSLKAQSAIILDPNATPEQKKKAAQVLRVYQDSLEDYVERNPGVHPDSSESDLSARMDTWLSMGVLLDPPN